MHHLHYPRFICQPNQYLRLSHRFNKPNPESPDVDCQTMQVNSLHSSPATAAAAAADAKLHPRYNHTDSCNLARWNARESYDFMHARPWHKVNGFYSSLVRDGVGSSALSILFDTDQKQNSWEVDESCEGEELFCLPNKERTGRWERATFKIVLSYRGDSFDGWQKQPGLNTVQGVVEKSLGIFVDEEKAQQLRDRSLPVEGCATVAGRTDRGVTALQQVCSFYTWRKDVKSEELKAAIDEAAPGMVRALSVSAVSRSFHPNFSAKWRRYFYIFPLTEEQKTSDCSEKESSNIGCEDEQLTLQTRDNENGGCSTMSNGDETGHICSSGNKPRNFSVDKVDILLRQLEGKTLSYKLFARDTKASRSTGPATECFMFHARAAEATLPRTDQEVTGLRVMCVELVGNRFLRKMVRVVVATAMREVAAGAPEDSLINLMDASCRRATAPPAPAAGLCLVDVGYTDFDQNKCLII